MQVYNDELYHYGVKGMRWGIRHDKKVNTAKRRYNREQEKLKSMTKDHRYTFEDLEKQNTKISYAKEDYKNSKTRYHMEQQKNKSKHQLNLEKEYMSRGMTKEEAELAAYKKDRNLKMFTIAAGISAAAIVAYGVYKHYDYSVDKIIKPGTTMQHITKSLERDPDRALYTSRGKDNYKYRGLYGTQIKQQNGTNTSVYKDAIKVEHAIKIVSEKNGLKTMQELAIKNPSFKQDIYDTINRHSIPDEFKWLSPFLPKSLRVNTAAKKSLSKGIIDRKVYEAWNIALVEHEPDHQKNIDLFFHELKSKGYDALGDINDKKFSGYNSNSATIIFNGKEKIKYMNTDALSQEAISRDFLVASGKILAEQFGKVGVAGVAVNQTKKHFKNEKTRKATEQYIKEHPNTKLTYTEVERMLRDK